MTFNFSYDFANEVRSMNELLQTVVQKNPVTSRLITFALEDEFDNKKMEWLDDVTSPLSWLVNTIYTAGDGFITSTDTTNLKEGMVLQFDKATTNARSTLVAKVGTITPNVSFVITVFGGSVDENIAAGSTISLLDLPSLEGSDAQDGDGFEPEANFNYSQIMDEFVTLTWTAYNSKMYGVNKTPGDIINYLLEKKLAQIAYKLGATTINMPRTAGSNTVPRTMGGRFWFLKNTVNAIAVNGSAAGITGAKLNEAFKELRSRGGMGANTIVAHPTQASRLAALNVAGNNPVIQQDSVTAGSYVSRFVTNFGDMATIIYSYDMDQDKIAIIDPTLIRLRTFVNDGLIDMDATVKGSRKLNRRITGQFSLEVKNVTTSHAYIYNLLA